MRRTVAFNALAAALVVLAAYVPADEADVADVFASWTQWADETAALEETVQTFAGLEAVRFDGPGELLHALSVRDHVYRRARIVEGYVYLRLQLDSADEEALRRQPRLDAVDAAWNQAGGWFDAALEATGWSRIEGWVGEGSELARYEFYFVRRRRRAEHALPPDALFAEVAGALRRQLSRARDALARAEAPTPTLTLSSGDTLTITAARARTMLGELPDARDRHQAQRLWLSALGEHSGTYAALLAGIIAYERQAAHARGFSGPLAASLSGDGIPAAAVLTAIRIAREHSAPLRRYHALRRARLGIEHYGTADRFAVLDSSERLVPYHQARELIIESAALLGTEIQATVRRAFEDVWIDRVERPGKRANGGSTFVGRGHPHVLVSYRGTIESLFVLAHEIGHAVHAVHAEGAQPWIYAHPSTQTGEAVASVHEGALVDLLSRRAATDSERQIAADYAIQNLLRLFYRPVIDADFELRIYQDGFSVTKETLRSTYVETLRSYYGDVLEYQAWDGYAWQTIPHYFSSPLYMGKYPLSSAAAMGLLSGLTGGDADSRRLARERFLALVRAGASDDPSVLFARAGVRLADPATIAAVPARLTNLIDALERSGASGGTVE